ncbi:hypothetical protein HZB89_01185 [archaeon]|nr:hypothetical protein [archaeon]
MVRKDLLLSSVKKLIDLGLSDEEITVKLEGIGIKRQEIISALKEAKGPSGFNEEKNFGLEEISLHDVQKVIEMKEETSLPEIKAPEVPKAVQAVNEGKELNARIEKLEKKLSALIAEVKAVNQLAGELIESALSNSQ